jgi:hypothetical protein
VFRVNGAVAHSAGGRQAGVQHRLKLCGIMGVDDLTPEKAENAFISKWILAGVGFQ